MIFNGKETSLREFIHVHDAALLSTQILENKSNKNKKFARKPRSLSKRKYRPRNYKKRPEYPT